MSSSVIPVEEQLVGAVRKDFTLFASELLKIRDKAGNIRPFSLNKAQQYIHERLEQQRAETGMVRAVILKGRQQGCSTYVTGRYFWRTVMDFGKQTYILTHEQAATDNLFGMTQRYMEHYPEGLRPKLGASNAKEMHFDELDSGYKIATAGNRGAGRSATAQYFLGSEVAYWPAADDHLAGILQTIPRMAGTEIIFESTANGVGNVFHRVWQQGEMNEGGWQAIFVPWFWQPEYVAPEMPLGEEDKAYGELYGLTKEQLAWRRIKIGEMGGDETLFRREYPATAAEAFSVADDQVLIPADLVSQARKSTATAVGPRILGVDPARFGSDRTVIVARQGRVSEVVEVLSHKDTMEVVGYVAKAIKKYKADAVFVDVGGLGAGIYDRLRELGYDEVRQVNAGEKASDSDRFVNKRAEMWANVKEWLSDGPVDLPDDDALQADLCSLRYSYDSRGRLKLESKDEAKKRGVRSPDLADALAMTLAYPVSSKLNRNVPRGREIQFESFDAGMGY
jgi:hypothetical protein